MSTAKSRSRSPKRVAVTNKWRLDGRHALITGSTKGIGLAAAREMLALGCSVCLVARSEADIKSTVDVLRAECNAGGERVHGVAADISGAAGRKQVVDKVSAIWGGSLDILVNNAGVNVRKPALEATDEEFVNIMRTNVDSCWFLSKSFYPFLAKGSCPCIVNVSSVAGVGSTGSGGIYAMSKAAVVQLTKTLACEWAKAGVRVNCVAPWITKTPMIAAAEKDLCMIDKASSWTPLGRPAEPEEIANAIVYFALPGATYVTGQTLCVDGGLTANTFAGPCVESL